jgi:hypothetical protein
MNVPLDKNLYERVKREADIVYNKPSAYKSGWLVKRYLELGGKYSDNTKNNNQGLTRWFKEDWKDIGHKAYPVYRPTRRISKATPLTVGEIDKKNLKEQIKLKQKIKGASNLPAFKKK